MKFIKTNDPNNHKFGTNNSLVVHVKCINSTSLLAKILKEVDFNIISKHESSYLKICDQHVLSV